MPPSAPEPDWTALLEELRRRHGAHTVLLYGSHARGEATPLWAWGDKMRARIVHPEPLTRAMHRATLLVEALPAWAQVRGRWYFGAKAALRSMAADDPSLAHAYAAAAAPGATTAAYLRLLDAVFDAALARPATSGPTGPPSEP